MTKSVKTTVRGEKTRDLIQGRTPFHAGGKTYGGAWNFRGDTADMVSMYWHTGRLPADFAEQIAAAQRDGTLTYVVWSYGTPIAWHDTVNGWTMPDTKYSISTTHHQSTVRYAISSL